MTALLVQFFDVCERY